MSLGGGLIRFSAVVFGIIGLTYLLIPGSMLSVVGVPSTGTTDFLMRTEGVALITAAAFLWSARGSAPGQTRVVLGALGLYYVLGSLVDLLAFSGGIVGAASVPSAVIRIAVAVLCVAAALRLSPAGSGSS